MTSRKWESHKGSQNVAKYTVAGTTLVVTMACDFSESDYVVCTPDIDFKQVK